MNTLNPNHPVTQQMSDQWHKIAALAVFKAGGHVVISMEDMRDLQGMAISVQEKHDGLHLKVITMEEGMRLAKEQGGLPQ